MVVKRDGSREPYVRDKVLAGVRKAIVNRPVTEEQVAALADRVEERLRRKGPQVSSRLSTRTSRGSRTSSGSLGPSRSACRRNRGAGKLLHVVVQAVRKHQMFRAGPLTGDPAGCRITRL